MLDWDPKGKQGPTTPLPDLVTLHTPKEEEEFIKPQVVKEIEVAQWSFATIQGDAQKCIPKK